MLATHQKSSARYDGGKHLANRKRHLAQTRSAVLSLALEIEKGTNTEQLAGCAGIKDVATLRAAAAILGRIEASYGKDAAEAKRIKDAHDARYKAAGKALHALLKDKIADVIALYAVAQPRDTYGYLNDLRSYLQRSTNHWLYHLETMQRDAIAELCYAATRQEWTPQAYCAALAPQLDEARILHAGLIAEVKAHAVAQRLEAAA